MVEFHLSGVNILISINHLGGNQLAIKVIFKYDQVNVKK
jgi:hypothetical protein